MALIMNAPSLTSALIVLHVLIVPFTSASKESPQTESFSGAITKTVTFLCSAHLGVPSSMVSPDNSLQIYFQNDQEMVVATLFWDGKTKLGDDFTQFATGATVQGNITEGWIEVTLPDFTADVHGNYKCVVINKAKGHDSGYTKYNRSLTVGRQSSRTLYSHPQGFQASIMNNVRLNCRTESGCFCNRSSPVELEDENLNKNSVASWQCENDLKKPLAQDQCHLSVMCGIVETRFNCTTQTSSSLYEFTCGQAVLSEINESSQNTTTCGQAVLSEINESSQNTTTCGQAVLSEINESSQNTTDSAKPNAVVQNSGFGNWNLFWIIPFSALVGALIFYFVLKQYFDISFNRNRTVSVQKKAEPCEENGLNSIQVDCNISMKEIQPLMSEVNEGLSEREHDDAAAATESVMLKPKDRKDKRRYVFPSVQDEETDIDMKL